MNRFPNRARFGVLIDAELSLIVLRPDRIEFRFVGGACVAVQYRVEYVDGSGRRHAHEPQLQMRPDPIQFHQLIGERVADLELEPLRLTLIFRSGRQLSILSNEGADEAGQISHPATELIAF